MDVKTKAMGVKSVEENHIVTFPEGLFGFEDYKKYATIESEWAPLIWLQSLDDERLAFLLIDPFLICDDYRSVRRERRYRKLAGADRYQQKKQSVRASDFERRPLDDKTRDTRRA